VQLVPGEALGRQVWSEPQTMPVAHSLSVQQVPVTQPPPQHTWPAAQAWPQAPQLFLSVCLFTQPVQQRV
jgi:hypothetical protein